MIENNGYLFVPVVAVTYRILLESGDNLLAEDSTVLRKEQDS